MGWKTVASQVIVHQASPTVRGFHFIALQDEFAMMKVIVRPDVYPVYQQGIRSQLILICKDIVL